MLVTVVVVAIVTFSKNTGAFRPLNWLCCHIAYMTIKEQDLTISDTHLFPQDTPGTCLGQF